MKDQALTENRLLDRMVLVGGPPRSGTTFVAKSLNLHPGFVCAIDDHVYECWGLYYNRDRVGLVRELRTRQISAEEAREILKKHLFADGQLIGAASSEKIKEFPLVSSGASPAFPAARSILDNDLDRHTIPLVQFSAQWRLGLKSPEISFVLPRLAAHFPAAQFVLVYRPVIEIAESMYRISNRVKRFPVFYKRWIEEKSESGELIPPPGVPAEWNKLWQNVSDFQRCVIYAAGYLRGLLQGIRELAPGRYFIYNHADLRNAPRQIFQALARFLGVEVSGFQTAETQLKTKPPSIPAQLEKEYSEIEMEPDLKQLMQKMESLNGSIHGLI